ncbi:MAG: prolipoprotein diacylglyceryl transferase [Patescibacteria group bacterium]|nr:prolipoprotein diacylglyceryl transferase [Patescibacteria group bacterium]
MLPILFTIGPIKIYTFGIFLVLALFWSFFVLWKNIRLTSYKEEEVFDGVFLSIFFGFFFSRLFYVILNFNKFGLDFLKFILINGYPGLSIYGFLFGFFIYLLFFSKFSKIKFLDLIDYFIPSFFIALIFGKLGAFFSGSEIGTKTDFFLKIKYLGFEEYRHLTAFYEVLFFIFGALISQKILFEIRKGKFFKGFLFYFSIWYFSLIYFLFDKIKDNKLYFFGFSFDYLVSLILLLTTTGFFVYYFRNNILSFIKNYGQKIFKKIYRRTKTKID